MIENHLVTTFKQKTIKRNKALNTCGAWKNKRVNINNKSIIENIGVLEYLYWSISSEYLSVFSPNVGKYGPEKSPYLDTFYAVLYLVIFKVKFFNAVIYYKFCDHGVKYSAKSKSISFFYEFI